MVSVMTDKYVSELPKCKLCGCDPLPIESLYRITFCGNKSCTMRKGFYTEQQWRTLMGYPESASAEPVAEVVNNAVGVDIAWIHPPSEGKRPPVGTKLYTRQPAQQWIKCSDRMPDVGQPVLVYGIDEYPVVAYITAIGWVCYATDNYICGEPTHWMPLPQEPESD